MRGVGGALVEACKVSRKLAMFHEIATFSRNLQRFRETCNVFTELATFSQNLQRFHGTCNFFTKLATFSRNLQRFMKFYTNFYVKHQHTKFYVKICFT